MVKAKVRKWRNGRSGWLVITATQFVVYRRKFIRGLEVVGNFETSHLRSAELDTVSADVRIALDGPQGDALLEVFSFTDRRQAETVNTVLVGLLKKAEEEKKYREEEAARLVKEREEHERQVREAFAADVWEMAEILWSLARANYSMVNAVITGNWSEARQQYSTIWQQADRLKNAHQIDLSSALKELDDGVRSENGEEVVRKAGSLLMNLSDHVLRTEALGTRWQEEKATVSVISPSWNHMPYFLLFGAGHFEILLSSQIEDWNGVNNGLSVLQSTSPVLRQCFDADLDELLDAVKSAAAKRDTDLFAETARRVESAVAASFKARPFKKSAPQLEGEDDGSLRK